VKRHCFRAGTAAAVAGLALLCAGCQLSADVIGKGLNIVRGGAAALKDFSWEEELEIGGTVAAQLTSEREIVKDEGAIRYVNLVALTVSNFNKRPEVQPRVLILRDDQPNAFACPGGYMFVTTGLVRLCRDESELAGVISHEVTHVALKHTLIRLKKDRKFAFAGTTIKELTPEQYKEAAVAFNGSIGASIKTIAMNNYGQEYEAEADRVGAECAAAAGYDGAGLARLIDRLPEKSGERGWKEFSKYPDGSTRAQKIMQNLTKIGAGGATNAERFRRELAAVLK